MQIVLVHGAFHDGRCWDRLISHLEALHFTVHAPTLRGHGDRGLHPYRVSMHSYVQDVCAVADRLDEPCVLLGHSMGGFPITAAAERRPELFSRLIYLSAFVPPMEKARLVALQDVAQTRGMNAGIYTSLFKGVARIDGEFAKELFYNTCASSVRERAAQHLCPQPLRPSLASVGWSKDRVGRIPAHYIECAQDRSIPLDGQRALQRHLPFVSRVTLDSDHSPFLSMPEQLAASIQTLVETPAGTRSDAAPPS